MIDWPNDKLPREGAFRRGEVNYYSVEARCTMPTPITIGGQIFDARWRRVRTTLLPNEHGAVEPKFIFPGKHEFGLLTWAQANAIRWLLVCRAEQQDHWSPDLETRIIEHRLRYDLSESPQTVHETTPNYAPPQGT